MPLTRAETDYDNHRNPTVERVLNAGIAYTLTQKTFDDRGRLTCEARRMDSASFGSPPADACSPGTTGAFGEDRITRNVYDDASQLRQVQRAVGTSIQQNYATYTYTTNGKQWTVQDANGNLTTYEYDGFDRLSKMRFPVATLGAGSSSTTDYEQYGYDGVGNRLTLRKRDGKVIGYGYDGLNRVRSKTVPVSSTGAAGYSVWYGYDVRGLQTFARFGSTTGTGITNQYDGFGWLRSSSTNMDDTPRAVTSDYDAHGNRTRLTHPGGAIFEYAHAADDSLMFISENGPSTALVSNVFDDFGRRKLINRDTSGTVSSFTFDEISRLKGIGHNLDGGTTTNDLGIGFSYNPASQVVARAQTNGTYDYPIGVVNQTYTSNGRNQYTQIAGTNGGTLAWDANGNLTSDGLPSSTTFTYDTENRLTSANGAKTATLTYDPMGRLQQVSNAAGTTRFLYDGDRLILEYDASGAIQRRYVHGSGVDEPMVWYEGPTVSSATRRYLHADHQGSIVATANAAGTKLDIGTYDAYGVTTAPSTWRFQYTGQTAIQQVGLYYYKARFYNPSLGRFMQTDPIGYDDDINLYAYVRNDPLNRTDPTGLCSAHDCPRTVSQETTRTSNSDGSVTVTRSATVVTQPTVAGPTVTASVSTGSISLQPQETANGAPAQVSEAMEGRLLNLSQRVGETVDVSSGIRSQEQQDALIAGGNQRAATKSQHTVGDAADISVPGVTKRDLAGAAVATGEFERVNIYNKGGDVHVDQLDVGPGTQLYENWRRVKP